MFHTTKFLKYLGNVSYKFARNFSSKDVLIKAPTMKPDTDKLLQNLRNSMSTKYVLQLVSDHHKIMNNQHILQALRSLFALQKSGNTNIPTDDIVSDPNFKILCNSLKSQVRSIELGDAIEALKIFSFVGIPSTSMINQVLLQLIRKNINQLSLQQIIFLDYLIRHFKNTPLSDALLIALPIVFEVHVSYKLDKENITQVVDCLQYISRKNVSDSTVELLVETLRQNFRNISTKDAIRISWSLCDLKPRDEFVPLLHKALRVIIENNDKIKFTIIETILTKLIQRINPHQLCFYNEKYFNMVAERVIDDNLGFQQTLWILSKFVKVGHLNRGLLNYVARTCSNEDVSTMNTTNIKILINAFAQSGHKPSMDWEKFKVDLERNETFVINGLDSVKFATRLAILDIFIPSVIENVFKEEYLGNLIQSGSLENCRNYLTLYHSVYFMKEELRNFLPCFEQIQKLIAHYNSMHDTNITPLKPVLEKAYGGSQYILTDCITRRGISIHHAIIMRKGGFPVAFNDTEQQSPIVLDELIYPVDSKIIAILGLTPSCYCLNDNELQGLYSLTVRSLEASGISTVTIPLQKWAEYPEHERIPYLMRAIREKSDSLEELHAMM